MEQVNHEIHEVEQHPAAAVQPFDVMGVMSAAVQLLHDRLRDAADVGVGSAGGDDEEIGGVVEAAKVQYDQLIALQILYGVQGQAKRLGRLRRRRPISGAS